MVPKWLDTMAAMVIA